MRGIAFTNEVAIKPARPVAALRSVCFADGARAEEGIPCKHDEPAESNQCSSGSQGTSGDAEAHVAQRGAGLCHDPEGHQSNSLGDTHGGVYKKTWQAAMAKVAKSKDMVQKHMADPGRQSSSSAAYGHGILIREVITFDRQLGAIPDPRGKGQDHGDCQGACSGKDPSKQAGRRGAGARLQSSDGSVIEEIETRKIFSFRIGKAGMNLIHHLQEGLRSSVAELVYGEGPVVWEMFCSHLSELNYQQLSARRPTRFESVSVQALISTRRGFE